VLPSGLGGLANPLDKTVGVSTISFHDSDQSWLAFSPVRG